VRRAWLGLILCASATIAEGADISVSGTWWRTVNRDDLLAGAGTGLPAEIESAAGVATLAIANTANGRWRVEVARATDVSWPPGVDIAIRRSSVESGVDGGTTYLTLTQGAQTLLEGAGDHPNIQVQLRLQGISLQTLTATYSLHITYTLVSLDP
jgi:hypothetical protein